MFEDNYGVTSFLATNSSFCDSTNQDTCITYLSKELVSLGFAPLYINGSNQCDKVKLINTIYNLLGHFSKERSNQEELQNRVLRLTSDLETQRCQHSRLQDKLEQSEKNAQNHQEKHRQVALKNKNLQSELKTEREECRRLQSVVQQRDAQYQHEQRRREREVTQLKERMLQLMSHKTPQQTPGMTLSNGLMRQDGRRGTWTTKAVSSRNEDDFQKRIVSGYEQRNKLLLEENTSLRELISTLHTEFNVAVQECDDDDPPADGGSNNSSPTPSILPFQTLQKTAGGLSSDKMQAVVIDSWHRLRTKWNDSIKERRGKCSTQKISGAKTKSLVN